MDLTKNVNKIRGNFCISSATRMIFLSHTYSKTIVFATMSDHTSQRFPSSLIEIEMNFTIGCMYSTVMCLSVLDKGMLNQTSLAKRQYPDLVIRWLFRLLYEQQRDIYQFSIRDSVDIIAQSYSKLICWTKHGR